MSLSVAYDLYEHKLAGHIKQYYDRVRTMEACSRAVDGINVNGHELLV